MTPLSHKILRRAASATAPFLPLTVLQRLLPRPLTGFFYHMVSDGHVPHVAHLHPYKTTAAFEADLLYLKAHFNLVGYAEILAHTRQGKALPEQAAFISFDDGYTECYSVVRPLLLKHNIPCIFFLTTNAMDNQALVYNNKASLAADVFLQQPVEKQTKIIQALEGKGYLQPGQLSSTAPGGPAGAFGKFPHWLANLPASQESVVDETAQMLGLDVASYLAEKQPYLTRQQVQQMYAEGFAFGGHTQKHVKLMFLPQAEQAREIVESCRVVRELLGEDAVPFAFPFSGAQVDRDFLARVLAENPGVGLLFDINQLRQDRPFIYNRIAVDRPVAGVAPEHNLAHYRLGAYRWTLVDRYTAPN